MKNDTNSMDIQFFTIKYKFLESNLLGFYLVINGNLVNTWVNSDSIKTKEDLEEVLKCTIPALVNACFPNLDINNAS